MLTAAREPHDRNGASHHRAFYSEHLTDIRWVSGGEGSARCPFHDDRHESFSVNSHGGLWFCHACNVGGTARTFAERLGIEAPASSKQAAESVFDYREESSVLLHQVVRFPGKKFSQRRPDGRGGWHWNLDGVRRVPYRLPELLASRGEYVFIPEGEKDVDRLRAQGFDATCNSGGARKWRTEYGERLSGRVCVLIADNDKPGRDHVEDVAHKLTPYAEKIINLGALPGSPEHGDVSDWFAAGHTAAELLELVQEVETHGARPGCNPEASADGLSSNEPPSENQDKRRPEIFVNAGQLRDKVTLAIAALEGANNPPTLFIRGGILTRLGRADDVLDELDSDGLLAELSEVADWHRHARREIVDAEPPASVIRGIRGRRKLPFPLIEGIARAPFFTERGELVVEPGFHSGAQIYLSLDSKLENELSNQRVPDRPTRTEVAAARQLLFEPFSQFPFADSASFAHTIGLMLLPFVRRMINGPVPIHGVVAPPDSAGTGKGLLVQTACVPGMGEVPSTPEVGSGEELRKKLLPVILADLPIFLFDNVTTELKGGVLASLLTARNWADRVLGRSQLFRGRVSTAFAFTANGPRCARDPEPWRRTGFGHVLPGWAFEHRAELINACLTLVHHWQALGRPTSNASLGSFERWAAVVGGILEATGIDGFLSNLDDDFGRAADETGARWHGFIEEWWREHGDQAVPPGMLVNLAYGHLIIRESKDGEPESKARSAATRLGLALNRRVGQAFKVKSNDDAASRLMTLTRTRVERTRGGTHQGFALKLAEQPPLNVGDVGEGPKSAEKAARTEDNLSANVTSASPTFFDNVRRLTSTQKQRRIWRSAIAANADSPSFHFRKQWGRYATGCLIRRDRRMAHQKRRSV